MAKCTGTKCPMQVGYKVDECNFKDCSYRTEPTTNADRIRAMNDDELADVVANGVDCVLKAPHRMEVDCTSCILKWLQQPTESESARETANYCPNCGAKMDGGGN